MRGRPSYNFRLNQSAAPSGRMALRYRFVPCERTSSLALFPGYLDKEICQLFSGSMATTVLYGAIFATINSRFHTAQIRD